MYGFNARRLIEFLGPQVSASAYASRAELQLAWLCLRCGNEIADLGDA